jgi:hypothetical protein
MVTAEPAGLPPRRKTYAVLGDVGEYQERLAATLPPPKAPEPPSVLVGLHFRVRGMDDAHMGRDRARRSSKNAHAAALPHSTAAARAAVHSLRHSDKQVT